MLFFWMLQILEYITDKICISVQKPLPLKVENKNKVNLLSKKVSKEIESIQGKVCGQDRFKYDFMRKNVKALKAISFPSAKQVQSSFNL